MALQAYYIDKEQSYLRIFYELDDFFHAVTIDSEHPFNAPAKRGHGNIAHSSDQENNFQKWINGQSNVTGKVTLHETNNIPGIFYRRMWRGNMQDLDSSDLAGSQSILSKSTLAGHLISEQLFDIFSYIEPIKDNQSVFGHKIREVLLLSCMEVESSWVSILTANDYSSPRFSTKDYVLLLDPMFLANYQVEFPMYPEIGVITPFKTWTSVKPTKSLSWYDAYNKTKHNREDNFNKATLESAINSVSAVAVMLCAQFGPEAVPNKIQVTLKNIKPNWPYIPLRRANRNVHENGTTQSIGYNDSSTWTQQAYTFKKDT